MQSAYPNYYEKFRCIADQCRHSCCIGWEIDIDAQTLRTYRSMSGEMGERLKRSVTRGKEPHFKLGQDERCPFLNDSNLCDLILFGGEEMLCQICADHPRFRNFLPTRTETGLGLCCEAAARLILSQRERTELTITGEAEKEDAQERALLTFRDRLFSIAQDRSRSMEAREEMLLELCGVHLGDAAQWVPFYLGLERMDEAWTQRLNDLGSVQNLNLSPFLHSMSLRETEYEQMLVYFLYRHVPLAYKDGDVVGKVAFAVLSVRLLRSLGAVQFARCGSFTLDDQIGLARLYSAEIEYSQENLDALFDALC